MEKAHDKESNLSLNDQPLIRKLSKKQKEFIKLLQNKEKIIATDKAILITCGSETKRINMPTFYSLINKGLIYRQTESPFRYLLSGFGKIIRL